jgi:hypothetical protein
MSHNTSKEMPFDHPLTWAQTAMRNDLGVLESHNVALDDIVDLPSKLPETLQQLFVRHAKSEDDEREFEGSYSSLKRSFPYNSDFLIEGSISGLCLEWLETMHKYDQYPGACVEYVCTLYHHLHTMITDLIQSRERVTPQVEEKQPCHGDLGDPLLPLQLCISARRRWLRPSFSSCRNSGRRHRIV